MRYYYILQFVFLLGLANALQAQDTHFSQNFANPIFLNPGITGIINGDTRVVGIYRSQWGSLVPENPFKTYLVSADMAFAGAGRRDRFGLGLMAYKDGGGAVNFATHYIDASFSYILALNDNSYLGAGFAGGMTQRGFDINNAQFDDQYIDGSVSTNPSADVGNLATSLWRANLGAGLLYYTSPSARSNFFTGIAMHHITSLNSSFTELNINDEDKVHQKISAQIGGNLPIGNHLDLAPSAWFVKQGPHQKIDIGTFFRYIFDSDTKYGLERSVSIGPWVRLGNHISGFGMNDLVIAGKITYDNLGVGLSYDINLANELKIANGGRGGFEISLSYTGLLRPSHRDSYSCPNF